MLFLTLPTPDELFVHTSFTEPTTLIIQAPISNQNSFYARHGNWFVWLLIGVLALILFTMFFRSKKP